MKPLEVSERTRLEMIAGKRARIKYALAHKVPLNEILRADYNGLVELVSIEGEIATVKVTSKLTGESTTITEPLLEFPSDALLTQCWMVCG